MSNTNRCVTYFDKNSWDHWGLSWISSLFELARFDGEIIVVDYGLSHKTRKFLNLINVKTIKPLGIHTQDLDCMFTIIDYAKNNPGSYAFWSNSSYFQDDIEKVFGKKKLICSKESGYRLDNKSEYMKKTAKLHGSAVSGDFWCADSDILGIFDGFLRCCIDNSFVESLQVFLNLFTLSFESFVEIGDWSVVVGNHLTWNKGFYNGESIAKVVSMNLLAETYKFSNRYQEIYSRWISYYKGSAFSPKRVFKCIN